MTVMVMATFITGRPKGCIYGGTGEGNMLGTPYTIGIHSTYM